MKCVREVIGEKGGNYIFPFLWMHGENIECILQEIDRICACGIKEICLESRPHPDFLGKIWWEQMDAILRKAREKQMRIWLLDDQHFPTGYSGGAYIKNPEKAKVYLKEFHMDLLGPAQNHTVFIEKALKDPEKILACWLYKRENPNDSQVNAYTAQDVTECYRNGKIQFSIGDGTYRLFVFYTSRSGGGHENYMNLLDSESVKILLDTVYEPHYRRYKQYFGSTFAGFFSDEPEVGNKPGNDYEQLPGEENVVYPWSNSLQRMLEGLWGSEYTKYLAALWFQLEERTEEIRYDYMEAVTAKIRDNFSRQIGTWCHDRGVEHIGHIIEDNNAHGRLGCSTGHYFRSLDGQDMSGIDVVSGQLMPGFSQKIHRWLAGEEDGEFFHFGLAKLGASGAAVDEKKKGRAMCELFGAYGWGEGVFLMKWLIDHMLVNGVNEFVPHAFSPIFPDEDCPPHFYAKGNNPQYGLFQELMKYLNRTAHLFHNGVRWTEAAVLYHAESEWTGTNTMLYQKPVRELLEHQLDCNIIPADKLDEIEIGNGNMHLAGYTYRCFIIPECDRIPKKTEKFVIEAGKQGIPIFVTGKFPKKDVTGKDLSDKFYQYTSSISLCELSTEVRKCCKCSFDFDKEVKDLRTCRYLHKDGSVCMFFNENTYEKLETNVRVHGRTKKGWKRYRAIENTLEELEISESKGHGPVTGNKDKDFLHLELEPGEAVILVEDDGETSERHWNATEISLYMDWEVSKSKGNSNFEVCLHIGKDEPYPNMNDDSLYPDYSGTFRYESAFYLDMEIQEENLAILYFPKISEGARIWLNEDYVGSLLEHGHYIELKNRLKNGKNRVKVEISNTLVWKMKDRRSAYMQIPPTGILENPRVILFQ